MDIPNKLISICFWEGYFVRNRNRWQTQTIVYDIGVRYNRWRRLDKASKALASFLCYSMKSPSLFGEFLLAPHTSVMLGESFLEAFFYFCSTSFLRFLSQMTSCDNKLKVRREENDGIKTERKIDMLATTQHDKWKTDADPSFYTHWGCPPLPHTHTHLNQWNKWFIEGYSKIHIHSIVT